MRRKLVVCFTTAFVFGVTACVSTEQRQGGGQLGETTVQTVEEKEQPQQQQDQSDAEVKEKPEP